MSWIVLDAILKRDPELQGLLRVLQANYHRGPAVSREYLVVSETTVRDYLAERLEDVSDLRLTLGDRSVRLTGLARRVGVCLRFDLELENQLYAPHGAIGIVGMDLKQVSAGLEGGLLRRLWAAIIFAIVRSVLGREPLLGPLELLRGVEIDDGRIQCHIGELDPIRELLDREIGAVRVGDLFQVADLVVTPGEIRVYVDRSPSSIPANEAVPMLMRSGGQLWNRLSGRGSTPDDSSQSEP